MFFSGICRKTVSILEALIWGSDGACIDLGMASVYTAVLAFCVAVVVLKYGFKALVIFVVRSLGQPTQKDTQPPLPRKIHRPKEQKGGFNAPPSADGGPIRTLR